ncbi:RluA family pseudouridine synthase [Blattabacterium cuenoti]|uniref:RluA family pseudouridine synthase n=1 Tax=Blattabacterium cuenoti TaxID=1653831 RepID=UPI00163CB7E5|nr:RluA family pseudouridine synthase [Blattabacterium cuenoti]
MNSSTSKIKIITDKNQKEIRIDKFLKNYIQNISRNQIQKWTNSGKILVNRNIIKKNYKIKPLDFVEIEIYRPTVLDHLEYKNITAEKINLDILHEDEDVIVVNKPAGMVVHPGFGNETGTLIHGIKYHLINSNFNKFNLYRCGLVHRLDKDTSGLLVLAKNEYSQKHLFQQFYSRTIQRKYIALIWGDLIEKEGIITGFIGRDPRNRKKMTIFKQNQEINKNKGKYSITHYKVLERFKHLTYISCYIKTGKTHQIRAHFKHLGHPLFHDSIYGGNRIFMKKKCSNQNIEFFKNCLKILRRQALHAISLSFIHPKNGKCYFYCPIPEDFKSVLKNCRNMLSQ